MQSIVAIAAERGASDIHIVCGLPIKARIHGELTNLREEPLTHDECLQYAKQLTGNEFNKLAETGEFDMAATFGGSRVRINIFSQQGHYSIVLRILSDKIPDLSVLGLPPAAMGLTELNRGIVLVTGETGSGKSTTLAAMLDHINQTRAEHIITLEDPVEYIYTPKLSIFNQREVGKDTKSFANGLRASLREDPDIILIGEMRDHETIETALTAAETGHLVFGTLHTNSAADSIDRVVDVFPEARQSQIRMQLSMTLRAVISQQLLPRSDIPGRALACELMIVNHAIKNLIREGKTPQIVNTIATSAKEGSLTMDMSIIKLYKERKISKEVALSAAHDYDYVKKMVY